MDAKWGFPLTCHLILNSGQPKGCGLLSGNLLHHVMSESVCELFIEWPKFLPPARALLAFDHVHLDPLTRVLFQVRCTSSSRPGSTSSHRLAWWSGASLWPSTCHRGGMMLVTIIRRWPQSTWCQGGRWAWSINSLTCGISQESGQVFVMVVCHPLHWQGQTGPVFMWDPGVKHSIADLVGNGHVLWHAEEHCLATSC